METMNVALIGNATMLVKYAGKKVRWIVIPYRQKIEIEAKTRQKSQA